MFSVDFMCLVGEIDATHGHIFLLFVVMQEGYTALMHAVSNQRDIVLNRLLAHPYVNVNSQDTEVQNIRGDCGDICKVTFCAVFVF